MSRIVFRVLTSLIFTSVFSWARVAELVWNELPSLPPAAGMATQPGVASPFVGVHGNVLLVGGGANFPDKMPWEGGAKVWWDTIAVLEKSRDGTTRWVTDKTFKLPRRIAYGASASTPDGVICAGGSDAERCYADVFLLSWDAAARTVRTTPLPAMPQPLANMAGALVGNVFYIAGGQHLTKGAVATSVFWALDLSKRGKPAEFTWEVLPTWPGAARVLPVAVAQNTARGAAFFLFSGRVPHAGQPTEILRDAYVFEPAVQAWRKLPDIGGGAGFSVMAGTAAPAGKEEILLIGGDRGDLFLELEAHDLAIEATRAKLAAAATPVERAKLEREIAERLAAKKKIYESHPGFGREVFSYDTARNVWRVVSRVPAEVAPPVTTTAVVWDRAVVIPSGEIRPGVRTPAVVRVKPTLR